MTNPYTATREALRRAQHAYFAENSTLRLILLEHVFFPRSLVWRRDTRFFLRRVNECGYVDPFSRAKLVKAAKDAAPLFVTLRWRKASKAFVQGITPDLRKEIPLVLVEEVVRSYRPLQASDPLWARCIAWVPVVRDAALLFFSGRK
eukprot:Sspe_Gene.112923::Locus_96798_Transcript_1_1_Confidence_1.000_Length_536::g.112923::m.112923